MTPTGIVTWPDFATKSVPAFAVPATVAYENDTGICTGRDKVTVNVKARLPVVPSSTLAAATASLAGGGTTVPGASGRTMGRNTWSAVAAELFVETRILQLR